MGWAPVPPDWPPLAIHELREVLPAWGLQAAAVTWRSPRPFSAAAIVEVSDGAPVFVKRHHPLVRSSETLAGEHAFGRHLRAGGQPVPEVLPTSTGATTATVRGWAYEVQRCAPGADRYRDALAWTPYRDRLDAFGAGVALGRFHRAAAGFDAGDAGSQAPAVLAGGNAVASSDDPVGAVARLVERRPALAAWLSGRAWRDEVAPLLEPWPPVRADGLWGHGDWHPTNLMWRDTEVAAVVDLGLAAPTGAPWDVAVAIERAVVGWLDLAEGRPPPVDHQGLAALLAGYRQEAPLDLAAVAGALPLAHVDFALSEVEYFAAVTRSETNATLAWDGYLCGHLRWWAGTTGRSLLEEVKGAACT